MEINVLDKIYDFLNGFIHPNELKIHIPEAEASKTENLIKKCPVTGLDISMQPKNSKFLSFTGVKWYYNHDHKLYSEVLAPRISKVWEKKELDEQFREISHRIRKCDSNPRHNTRRKIKKILSDSNSLFNNIDLIDKSKLKEAGLA
jgi:hypothetical protein